MRRYRREKKREKRLKIMTVICAAALSCMVLALLSGGKQAEKPAFVPPAFEEQAQKGIPEGADESWTLIYQEGMDFSAHVCGRVVPVEGRADIYFTNDADNAVWMKLRVLDEEGNILGETGLLKPGEYVKSVIFTTVPKNGQKVRMKVMAYEPETYYSAGTVTLNTVIGD